MNDESLKVVEGNTIRHQQDPESNKWVFSIVDVMAVVTKSKDPRNYWKVLKNRLKKGHIELVTNCNQLKMPSSDGKSYLTDVADSDTILEIVKMVSPSNTAHLSKWFESIENSSNSSVGTVNEDTEVELMVDAYETPANIIIEVMVGGTQIHDLHISVNYKTLTISGKRLSPENIEMENYLLQEIYWGAFARTVELPSLVQIDEVRAHEERGLLTIVLPKIDITRTRRIKIKSLK